MAVATGKFEIAEAVVAATLAVAAEWQQHTSCYSTNPALPLPYGGSGSVAVVAVVVPVVVVAVIVVVVALVVSINRSLSN